MVLGDDWSVLFQEGVFATAATWTPAGGGGATAVSVIFEDPHDEVALGEAGQSARRRVARIQDSELGALARGDTLTVNATNYRVLDIRADGQGTSFLDLHA